MEAGPSAQTAQSGAQSDPSRQQRPRNRRGRGRGRGTEASSLAFRPASIAPEVAAQAPSTTPDASTPRQRGRGGRGRGGARGRGGRPGEQRTVNGRAFGGQLTRDNGDPTDDQSANAQLQASAPVFVPGQQHVLNVTQSQPAQRQPRQPPQPKRRMSKSQAPDIATRTHEDIDNGHYECAICTAEVKRNSKVWSCHTCWTVFHMGCIKKWSSNEGSAVNQQNPQNGDLPPPRQWRCPGCNLPKDVLPGSYTCWCEKEVDPRSPAGIPPHSCGQSCGKERPRKCPHPCQLTCHAGPCPPCSHMGPTQSCFCGKHESTKRCMETDYVSGWSCGEVCNTSKPCGHSCPRPCHDGPCGPCEVRLPAKCYCGQVEKDILCSDQLEAKDSTRKYESDGGEALVESFIGVFDCSNVCDKTFDCGVHHCQKTCHASVKVDAHCPRSADVVTQCACGKTPLSELDGPPRQNCEDPIPSCNRPCEKSLPGCHHPCPEICHLGECPPCRKVVTINCRCGRTTSNTLCHQGDIEPPQCRRVCRVTLNCGRHACDEHCCAGESKAVQRQQSRKKQRPLNAGPRSADEGFEAEHICTRQCGRQLKCGDSDHICQELCHKGPCETCREAIFEEISCFCGRTVLQPPLPCGTQPPVCREQCHRLKPCGHPQVPHQCHFGDACPKCPFLVEKRCMCGKKSIKNQQCWLRDASCGEVCGKKLKCGSHLCRKGCHRGPCEDADGCKQPCGKEKGCSHPHEAPCHSPFPCKESETPCQSKIFITCPCQAQKQEIRCGASKTSEGNAGKSLPCNEECARLERNRKLAIALNIDQSAHVEGGDHVPYSSDTLNIFAQHVKWAQTQEREFRVFADSEDERRLRFKPMQPQQRAFIHSLAEDFGLDSESVDPEPHRHVMIWKTPRFVSAPNKTLADALRIRQAAQRSANASANVSDNESAMKPKPKILEPYNSFRITNPRFGLTIDEVRSEVQTVLSPSTPFTFDIEFLPSEDVVLKAISRTLPALDLERMLQDLKMSLATAITSRGYGTLQLCTTDSSLNITRYESDSGPGDGWSKVAAKKAAQKMNITSSGLGNGNNAFAALTSGKVTFAKKKPENKVKAEPVVDDWEAAEIAAEEQERSANASEDDGGVSTDAVQDVKVEKNDAVEQTLPEVSDRQDWAAEVEAAQPL